MATSPCASNIHSQRFNANTNSLVDRRLLRRTRLRISRPASGLVRKSRERAAGRRGRFFPAVTLELETQQVGAEAVVRVTGNLSGTDPSTGALSQTVERLLTDGIAGVAILLTGVTTVDAAGVGELVRTYKVALGQGASLRIMNAAPRVRRLLDLVGLSAILKIEDASVPVRGSSP